MEYKNQDENLIGELLRIKTYVDNLLAWHIFSHQ